MKTLAKKLLLSIGLAFLLLLIVAAVAVLFLGSHFKTTPSLVPNYSANDLSSKAEKQLAQGNYKEAETYLEQALSKEESVTYRNQLAVVKYRLKKYQESIDQYQVMIANKKDEAFAWNGIGNAYRDWADEGNDLKSDYQQKAVDAYSKAVAVDPTYIAAYSNWALLLTAQGAPSEAQAILDRGIAATKSVELQTIKKTVK